MDNLPLVTVIIPCFNREKYIGETVESVLNQTYPNIELMLVDDGCTDNTREVLEGYTGLLRILEHPGRVNLGQSAGINLGLKNARGHYIAILDSDDLFEPDKISIQVQFLEENPEFGLVYCNGKAIDDVGTLLYNIFPAGHTTPNGPEAVLENCCFNLPSNALIRKEVFEKAGYFDESLRTAQDHDMTIRLVEVALPGYIDQPLWYYRRHGESISHTKAKERWRNGFKILRAAVRRYPYPLGTRLRRRAVLYFRLGQCYQEEGSYLRAGLLFATAGLCDPLRSFKVLSGREKITGPH